jgi:hypothetical protein
MKQIFKRNGLSIVLFGLFLFLQIGLSVVGQHQYNQQQENHGQLHLGYFEYLSTGNFLEATMENWESEFLQMFAYVLLTVFLFQEGSPESKKLNEPEPVDRNPNLSHNKKDAPWPVCKGGIILKIYEYSLSLALLLLFIYSFILHVIGGAQDYNLQELAHGGQAITTVQYLGTTQFWFESLQNWQSEFFSIGIMVIFTIILRQRGSPQSKPVDSSHDMTGRQ